ncbi:MAG: M10 family metallopeptidase C-terminal domain-containing protein, partial [Alphaproteobacteria bacterium]|nr:M10 family metallopeptidase C-terminal domain-containing protein [Alphaproteobacteria bacterium]
MTISYDDFKKLLLQNNYVGDVDDLDETLGVPNDQTVNQVDGKYVITYSFFTSDIDIPLSSYYSLSSEEVQEFVSSSDYQQNIEDAYKNQIFASSTNDPRFVWFQQVANITFSETQVGTNDLDGSGSIDQPDEYTTGHIAIGQLNETYSHFTSPEGTASAVTIGYNSVDFPENPELKKGDIFFNVNNSFWDGALYLKSQQFKVLLEEALHSLGVDTKTVLAKNSFLDNQKYSVAAYSNDYAPGMDNFFTGTVAPHTLQIMDIAALQEIYGRNYTSFAGDTQYTLSVMNPTQDDSAFLYTIWDGDGDDTINVSTSTVSAEIDLRQGHFSSIGKDAYGFTFATDEDASASDPDPGNVAIAFYAVIENATGTDQDDSFILNFKNNVIDGQGGFDTVDYSHITSSITVTVSDILSTAIGTDIGTDSLIRIEKIIGGSGRDILDLSFLGSGVQVNGDWITLNGNANFSLRYEGFESLILTPGEDVVVDVEGVEIDGNGGADIIHQGPDVNTLSTDILLRDVDPAGVGLSITGDSLRITGGNYDFVVADHFAEGHETLTNLVVEYEGQRSIADISSSVLSYTSLTPFFADL